MYYLNFRIIKLMVVWMQRFEICDFVCKKACIKWDRASCGELRYIFKRKKPFTQETQHRCITPTFCFFHQPTNQPGPISTLQAHRSVLPTTSASCDANPRLVINHSPGLKLDHRSGDLPGGPDPSLGGAIGGATPPPSLFLPFNQLPCNSSRFRRHR
jgi:hypothetical protein